MGEGEKIKPAEEENLTNEEETEDSGLVQRVVDSMEMAGKALDFFEEESSDEEEEVEIEAAADSEHQLDPFAEEEQAEEPEQEALLEEVNQPQEFVDDETLVSVLESVLFATDKPIGVGIFKAVFKGTNIKTKDIKRGLEELQKSYVEHNRGVTLEEISGGWQLRTKVDNMPFMRKLGKTRPFKLSGPALEVLSIVAYKQPIVKSEVDHIRGVESGHLVRALMERGLVSFQGKSELPGKPMQYGTTRKFLEIFGLRNLKELPSLEEIDQLLPDGIGYEDDDETLSSVTDSMSEDYQGNYSEGEEELEKIVDKLSAIDTSSEFFEEEKRRQREKRDRDRARDIQEALDVGEEVEEKDQRWLEKYLAAQEPEQVEEEQKDPESLTETADQQDLATAEPENPGESVLQPDTDESTLSEDPITE